MAVVKLKKRKSATVDSDYNLFGIVALISSAVLIIYFYYCFADSVYSTINYNADVCTITYMEIIFVTIDSINDSGYLFEVQSMPCYLVHVDSKRYKNFKFYRNYNEKKWTIKHNSNV